MCMEICCSEVGHGLEERHGDIHADDGSGLQQALLFPWQEIDAYRQHRLDQTTQTKLETFTYAVHRSAAKVIRQLIAQATPEDVPQRWHLAAQER
jgi:hypothetical protein